MHRPARRSARVIASLVVVAILYSLGLILAHTHLSGDYRPDCPACHQERAIGSSSGPVAVAHVAPTPILIEVIHDLDVTGRHGGVLVRQTAPRSPPASA